jgi:predicted small lipoprotein YifL
MKKTITTLAVLLVLAALAGGGLYLYKDRLPGLFPPAQPGPPAPAPAETPAPLELQPPVLSGETEAPSAPEGSPAPAGSPARAGSLATLVDTERTVKAKRASDLSWEDAQQQMPLNENDAVRTFDKSSATISFGPDDLLEVDQNSLVIIKPRPQGAGDSEISLALLSSDFLDGLASKPAPEQAKAIQAAASSRQVTIKALPEARRRGEKTRVAVRTLPDRSTSVAALSGSLKISGPKGGEVTLKEKMVTKITEAGVLTPRLLPSSPEPLFPADGAIYGFQRKAPRVELKWRAAERARSYRLIVATDAQFKRIFADEKVDTTSLPVRIQQPGTYYWRVRAQDAEGFAGPYSAVRSVRADYDDTPPALAILSPPEMFVAPAPSVEIKGKTEREARVKVNGQKAAVEADGTFTFPLALKEGVNLVTIEVIDAAGNSEYGKRLITYKGSKRATAAITGN